MNHIKQLQADKAQLQESLDNIDTFVTEKLKYLYSSKFQGHENDFVNGREVATMMFEIRSLINNIPHLPNVPLYSNPVLITRSNVTTY